MRRLVDRSGEGDLSVEERWQLDNHIAGCETCARYEECAQRLDAVLELHVDPPVAAVDVERAVTAIRAKIELAAVESPPAVGLFGARQGLRFAAAAVVLISAGFGVWWALGDDGIGPVQPEDVPSERVASNDQAAPNGQVVLGDAELIALPEAPVIEVAGGPAPGVELNVPPATIEDVLGGAATLDDDALLEALKRVRGDQSRLRLIENALFSDEQAVALGAARALGLSRDRMSLIALRRALLKADDLELREQLVDAVVAFGPQGLPTLTRALGQADIPGRSAILSGLQRFGGETVATCLDDDWQDQLAADQHAEAAQSLEHLLASEAGVRVFDSVSRYRRESEREFVLGALRNSQRAASHFGDWLEADNEPGATLWRFAEVSETDAIQGWLTERITGRSTRRRALQCLDAWAPEAALPVLVALEERGIGSLDLVERLVAKLEQDPVGCATVAGDFARRADAGERWAISSLSRLSSLTVAAGTPSAAPLLRTLIVNARHLDGDQARWLALALAEVGDAATGVQLVSDLKRGIELGRYERAAVWIAVARTAGTEALEPLLEELTPRARAAVLSALDSPNTVSTARVARVLDRTFDPERTALLP